MSESNQSSNDGKGSVCDRLVKVLEDMTSDWDTGLSGGINRETKLVQDLSFESIDIVQLVVAIEEHFGKRNFSFEKLLMVDGRYVDDLSVGKITDFLEANLQGV